MTSQRASHIAAAVLHYGSTVALFAAGIHYSGGLGDYVFPVSDTWSLDAVPWYYTCGRQEECVDTPPDWKGSGGSTCEEHKTRQWCVDGTYGPNWCSGFGYDYNYGYEDCVENTRFDDYENENGITADEACCVCGGGSTRNCPDDKKHLFILNPHDALGPGVNILAVALVVTTWSGTLHVAVAADKIAERPARWIDYCLTAPLMMVVLNTLFGASNIVGAIVAPLVLCACLVVAAVVEIRAPAPALSPRVVGAIVLISVAYVLTWVPAFYAIVDATKVEGDTQHPDHLTYYSGSAPDWLPAALGVMVAVFSSFAVVYYIDAFYGRFGPAAPGSGAKEVRYVTLSLIAKTTLHLLIGLTVVAQGASVSVGGPGDAPSDMSITRDLLVGSAALVIGISCIQWYVTTRGGGSTSLTTYDLLMG